MLLVALGSEENQKDQSDMESKEKLKVDDIEMASLVEWLVV
jgi:hypothetical protein